ncbi:unnamed protein product [Echinostoma caproni]|uniref:Uncharacterized protein n=1 Tax=Echinostoma caproni TaxID=27848 RepID=A0A182ZZX7_9TREM|nr:unnamed protein product [Echinostoma caproni]
MEGGTNRAPASERIKNGTHPTRRADVAAGSTSRDNVDYYPKRTNRQSQPDRRSAANQKDKPNCTMSELSINVSRATIRSNQPEQHAEEEATYAPSADQNQQGSINRKRRESSCHAVEN